MVNENINFKVDESKCTKCGLCVKDCPMSIIKMDNYPEIILDAMPCILCEHCLAICPTSAVSILEDCANNFADISKFDINPDELKKMIISRRSIRQYKNEIVDKNMIKDLCETALHAPTARNAMNTLLTVIDDKEKMDKFRDKFYENFYKMDFKGTFLESYASAMKKAKDGGRDKLFAGAPHIIVASAPIEGANIASDPVIILSYFELLAVSNGLGTLWDGIVTFLLNEFMPEFKDYLKIPKDHKVGYVMVFGKPSIKYHRGVRRNLTNINILD